MLVFVNVQLQRDRRLRAQDKELAEKKIAIMLSQIQPHFLYNILGSIEWLCETNPQKAQEATDELARFLRGNMDSLQSTRAIPASRELEHVRCYLNLERIRFGAHLRVEYAIETSDFFLPALSCSRWWRTRYAMGSPSGRRAAPSGSPPGRRRRVTR